MRTLPPRMVACLALACMSVGPAWAQPADAHAWRSWEFQLPVDRLTGQTALLWARLHAARLQWQRVVVVAERLIKVNPDSAYGPQLLLQAAEAYLKLGQPATATGALRRIVENYPESALAAEARRRMGDDR